MNKKSKLIWWLLLIVVVCCWLWQGYSSPQHNLASWSAYSIGGKPVPVTFDSGDVVTLKIPTPSDRIQCVAFLTKPLVADLTSKTITATISIVESGIPNYRICLVSLCTEPANVRLYFSDVAGAYSLTSANRNQTQYWWADFAFVNMGNGMFTLTAPLDGSLWSDSQGVSGADEPGAFATAARNSQQVGFAFGSCFWDVGFGLADNNGSSTLHVLSFTIQ